jgi:hypothetical protein
MASGVYRKCAVMRIFYLQIPLKSTLLSLLMFSMFYL